MEYMLTFHILNVYVDKTQPRQFKFTFKVLCISMGVHGSAHIIVTKIYGPALLALRGGRGMKCPDNNRYVTIEWPLNGHPFTTTNSKLRVKEYKSTDGLTRR